jgi:hypothetical protein
MSSVLLAGVVAAVTLAGGVASTSPAHADSSPAVSRTLNPAIVNVIPFIGCGGEIVLTTFSGRLETQVIVFPDGATTARLAARETGTWQQDGVAYTAAVVFNINETIRDGQTTTAITLGHGTGSDGTTVRLHDVIHLAITPARDLAVSFDKGTIQCG